MATVTTVGDRVKLKRDNLTGTVQFIGPIKGKKGIYFGIDLDETKGKNDGSVQNHYYFKTSHHKGLFVKKSSITKTNPKRNTNAARVTVGDKVWVTKTDCNGIIRWIGKPAHITSKSQGTSETWYGIELEKQKGKSNGTITDHWYFTSKDKHALFVKSNGFSMKPKKMKIDKSLSPLVHKTLIQKVNSIATKFEGKFCHQKGAKFKMKSCWINDKINHLILHSSDLSPFAVAICNIWFLKRSLDNKYNYKEIYYKDLIAIIKNNYKDLYDKVTKIYRKAYNQDEILINNSIQNNDEIDSKTVENDSCADQMLPFSEYENGFDLKIKFTDITDFESDLALFRLFDIRVFHGLVVNPQHDYHLHSIIKNKSFSDVMSALKKTYLTTDNKNVSDNKKVAEFLINNAETQLTPYALTRLLQVMDENELALMYRNKHFTPIHKENGCIYELVSNKKEVNANPDIVWQLLIESTVLEESDDLLPFGYVRQNIHIKNIPQVIQALCAAFTLGFDKHNCMQNVRVMNVPYAGFNTGICTCHRVYFFSSTLSNQIYPIHVQLPDISDVAYKMHVVEESNPCLSYLDVFIPWKSLHYLDEITINFMYNINNIGWILIRCDYKLQMEQRVLFYEHKETETELLLTPFIETNNVFETNEVFNIVNHLLKNIVDTGSYNYSKLIFEELQITLSHFDSSKSWKRQLQEIKHQPTSLNNLLRAILLQTGINSKSFKDEEYIKFEFIRDAVDKLLIERQNSKERLKYGFQIFVKTHLGKQMTLVVQQMYTIQDLKIAIEQKTCVPWHQQSLSISLMRKPLLNNTAILSDYNIHNGSTLLLETKYDFYLAPPSSFVCLGRCYHLKHCEFRRIYFFSEFLSNQEYPVHLQIPDVSTTVYRMCKVEHDSEYLLYLNCCIPIWRELYISGEKEEIRSITIKFMYPMHSNGTWITINPDKKLEKQNTAFYYNHIMTKSELSKWPLDEMCDTLFVRHQYNNELYTHISIVSQSLSDIIDSNSYYCSESILNSLKITRLTSDNHKKMWDFYMQLFKNEPILANVHRLQLLTSLTPSQHLLTSMDMFMITAICLHDDNSWGIFDAENGIGISIYNSFVGNVRNILNCVPSHKISCAERICLFPIYHFFDYFRSLCDDNEHNYHSRLSEHELKGLNLSSLINEEIESTIFKAISVENLLVGCIGTIEHEHTLSSLSGEIQKTLNKRFDLLFCGYMRTIIYIPDALAHLIEMYFRIAN